MLGYTTLSFIANHKTYFILPPVFWHSYFTRQCSVITMVLWNIEISFLLQIYHWVCMRQSFENRLIFGEVMGKRLVYCFIDSQCNMCNVCRRCRWRWQRWFWCDRSWCCTSCLASPGQLSVGLSLCWPQSVHIGFWPWLVGHSHRLVTGSDTSSGSSFNVSALSLTLTCLDSWT